MQALARWIDALNEHVGVWTAYLILPMVGVTFYEVFMRYALKAPTVWAFEMTTFIYGVHFVMAFGYAHKHDGHVAIDVFEARMPPRPRAVLRVILNLTVFLPSVGLLTLWSIFYAHTSWQQGELSWTSWAPRIYPYKILMAAGFALFWLQGLAKLLQDLRTLRQ
ncbi:MAG: TRAP transporter small permease subunit [Deferrisomatales bacterium]|nr:TRAP transporter small permease subunit [Deferrisomatales bacterium]